VIIATAQGKIARFHETDVRAMGRDAAGVIGIRLARAVDFVVSMSVTVTVKLAVEVFPCVSVAVQVTVVVPTANFVPEDGPQVGVIEPSTLSVAVAVYVTTAPEGSCV